MHQVLGCQIYDEQFTRWGAIFISELAPYFYSGDLNLPDELLVLSRKAFSAAGFDLNFRDAYTTYAVSSVAEWVVLLTPPQFDALPLTTQQSLLAEQYTHQRGQVYPWEQVERHLQAFLPQIESRCVTVSGKRYLVMDAKVWSLFPPDVRRQWLIDFITSDTQLSCLSSIWAAKCDNRMVQQLAGTFADSSGPNCLSTTLAAITQDETTATVVANFWLHQEPFFQGLARRGYHLRTDLSVSTPELRDAVLVWYDGQGQAQHACYVTDHGLVLNKNSQTWASPRQLLPLQTLLDDWKSYGYAIQVYSRGD